jgi:hypothetical protein
MNRHSHPQTFAVALVLAAAVQSSIIQAATLRTVAFTGQPVAGTTGGATFESFSSHYNVGDIDPIFRGPVLNDAGQTAFRANLVGSGVDSTNNQGVWSEGSGTIALVARTGSQAPPAV